MKINADYRQRVRIDTETQPWIDSPAAGVQRRMLDREGAESGRATSLVRFAPDSYFPEHDHPGGEEYLVLEGIFSDETGDFGPGMYLRNPVGSAHRPFTRPGCVIFVKLCQMDPRDQQWVRIDTTQPEDWRPGAADGVTQRNLHRHGGEAVSLLRWQPGSRSAPMEAAGGMEILVLDGVLEDESGRYPKGTWLRLPPGSRQGLFSREGATAYIKIGHLAWASDIHEATA